MRNIKLTIEYDGTDFRGWQIQKQGERTVQQELKTAIQRLLNEDVSVIGSGRTDTGVHARGQVANFKTRALLPASDIQRALNAILPRDIVVRDLAEAPEHFHAQYSAKTKTYCYAILTRKERSPLDSRYSMHFPFPLDLNAMRAAAKTLIGRHDFKSFQASGSRRDIDTVRTISRLDIRQPDDYLWIEITADGFLYKMVRNIVGTLLEIGAGRRASASMKDILSQKSRCGAGDTAKPHGLTLLRVAYDVI
ncbi:MAG: tRNA pseudouridine(38-40) synthase TruA [Candidatus Omnitrophica bacterium]|nr:tRNA pseudouridine(38-40) synthase TruA [Candidatus Omnitrophota bacterium]